MRAAMSSLTRVEAALAAQAVEQLLRLVAAALGVGSPSASRTSSSETSMLLGLDDRGEDGLAAERLLGVGLGLLEQLLLGLLRDPQVGVLAMPWWRERVQHVVPAARARAPRRARRGRRRSRWRRRRRATASRYSRSICSSRPPRGACGCRRAARRASRSRRPRRAKSSSSSGSCLRLTSLTVTSKTASLPARCSAPVVGGERRPRPCGRRRPCAGELLLEAGDEPAGAELEQLVAALAALERLAVDRALVVHDDEVAVLGGALEGVQARGALAQLLDLLVDLLVVGRRARGADLERPCTRRARLRAHADLDRERQRLALAGQARRRRVGVADGRDAGVVDRARRTSGRATRGWPRRGRPRGRRGG